MSLHIHSNLLRKIVFTTLGIAVLGVAVYVIYGKITNGNPLPSSIRNEVNFSVVYPSSKVAQIDAATYEYQDKTGVLSFNTSFQNTTVSFSEQIAPTSLGSGTQTYYPALGIHPYAQFVTKLGPVALTKFWQSGTLQPVGQSGIMVAKKTLLITHTDKSLTNQQWKTLFDGLKMTK